MKPNRTVIRVLCVDDHPLVLEGVARKIGRQPDMKVIGTAISGEDAVEMYERHRPDVVMERKFPNGTWAEWRKLYTLSA